MAAEMSTSTHLLSGDDWSSSLLGGISVVLALIVWIWALRKWPTQGSSLFGPVLCGIVSFLYFTSTVARNLSPFTPGMVAKLCPSNIWIYPQYVVNSFANKIGLKSELSSRSYSSQGLLFAQRICLFCPFSKRLKLCFRLLGVALTTSILASCLFVVWDYWLAGVPIAYYNLEVNKCTDRSGSLPLRILDPLSALFGAPLVFVGLYVLRDASKHARELQTVHQHERTSTKRSQFRILLLVAINAGLTYAGGILMVVTRLINGVDELVGVTIVIIESSLSCLLSIVVCWRIRQRALQSSAMRAGKIVPITMNKQVPV